MSKQGQNDSFAKLTNSYLNKNGIGMGFGAGPSSSSNSGARPGASKASVEAEISLQQLNSSQKQLDNFRGRDHIMDFKGSAINGASGAASIAGLNENGPHPAHHIPMLHGNRNAWNQEFNHVAASNQNIMALENFQEYEEIYNHQRSQQEYQKNFQAANEQQIIARPMVPYNPQAQMIHAPIMRQHLFHPIPAATTAPLDNTLQTIDWNREFQQKKEQLSTLEKSNEIGALDNRDALAKTAGVLAGIIQESENPKFHNSKFLGLMQQFRDKEVAIEGDKVVKQIDPVSKEGSLTYAQEFLQQQGQQVTPAAWEEDFSTMDQPPRNYKEKLVLGDVSHDMDISEDFMNRLQHIERSSEMDIKQYEKELEDMGSQFNHLLNSETKEKMTPEEAQAQWREWEDLDLFGSNQSHIKDHIEEYGFVQNNPFLKLDIDTLLSISGQNNLTESILTLEAAVQKDPKNASAWYDLGKKQQENENEGAAIIALQKCIEIDPQNIDAYLAIAVSFTNENSTIDAQNALIDWLKHTPNSNYTNLISPEISKQSTATQVNDMLIKSYLEAAAISNQTGQIDADVQQALGILFTITNDYSKAIDCFKTALACRPDEYQVWNKLGATLANGGESEKAMEAYFNAVQINPFYIRARYNLAIACMQLGQYQEAAVYLLQALSIQDQSLNQVVQKTTPELVPEMRQLHTGQSDSVWNGLRMLLGSYIRRDDLNAACDARDLNAFRGEFDF